jgi:hypothetical protein
MEEKMIERAKSRVKLLRPLLIPFVIYILFLTLSSSWLGKHSDSPWRYAIALSPMLPGIWIAIGVFQAIQRLDEMERLVLMEGIVVSFIMTLILVLSLGLLQTAGFPLINGIYIGFVMILMWLIAKLIIHRGLE